MPQRTVTSIVEGKAGSGKTYRCILYLIKDLLPESDLRHISNFPYDTRVVALAAAKRKFGNDVDENDPRVVAYEARLAHIPAEELDRWREGSSGPWELWQDASLDHVHISIDEIHEYAGINHEKSHIAKWQKWCGQLRHQGATVEFVTQNIEKVAREIRLEAGLNRRLIHSDERPDPFFKIPLGDWYELRAKLTGVYLACVWEETGRIVGSKWFKESTQCWWLRPRYFKLYDSYSKPESGGRAGTARKREFERRSAVGLLWWFCCKHATKLIMHGWMFVVPVALLCGGGGPLFSLLIHMFVAVGKRNMDAGLATHKVLHDAKPALPTVRPSPSVEAVDPLPHPPRGFDTRRALQANQVLFGSSAGDDPFAGGAAGPVGKALAWRRYFQGGPIAVVQMVAPLYVVWDAGEITRLGEAVGCAPWMGAVVQAIDVRAGTVELVGGVLPGGRVVCRCGVPFALPLSGGRGGVGTGAAGRPPSGARDVRGSSSVDAAGGTDGRPAVGVGPS